MNSLASDCQHLPLEERAGLFTVQCDNAQVLLWKKVRQVSVQPITKDSGALDSRFLSYDANPPGGQHPPALNPFVLPPWNLRGKGNQHNYEVAACSALRITSFVSKPRSPMSSTAPVTLKQAHLSDSPVLDKL